MKKVAVLQEYLKALYEAYDVFQSDYKRLHKRSKLHNREPAAEYYLRWRDKMRVEIRRIEVLLLVSLPSPCKPCINTQLKVENGELELMQMAG